MGLFGSTDWVKKSEELKVAWERAQQVHNFAPPGLKRQRLQELHEAKRAYEEAIGKALLQKAKQKKKDNKKKK